MQNSIDAFGDVNERVSQTKGERIFNQRKSMGETRPSKGKVANRYSNMNGPKTRNNIKNYS